MSTEQTEMIRLSTIKTIFDDRNNLPNLVAWFDAWLNSKVNHLFEQIQPMQISGWNCQDLQKQIIINHSNTPDARFTTPTFVSWNYAEFVEFVVLESGVIVQNFDCFNIRPIKNLRSVQQTKKSGRDKNDRSKKTKTMQYTRILLKTSRLQNTRNCALHHHQFDKLVAHDF